MRRHVRVAAVSLAGILAWWFVDSPSARSQSTTTTTTVPVFPTTTTLDVGTDVNGGGRFHAGFGLGGYDTFSFDVTTAVVLLTETSNGADLCSGDTTMELRLNGFVLASDDDSGPGKCSRIERRLDEPGEYELKVAGFSSGAVSSYVLDVEFVETTCGNDVLEPLEECDDGNLEGGDCCASDCAKEADASPCDDGLVCNGDDSCSNGLCVVHALNPCPGVDGDSDCAESCSDTVEGCAAPDPDSSPCNDNVFCNGADKCLGGNCIVHVGDPCRGPDGDGRCNESCKESLDSCSAADPSGTVCDDGLFCTGSDTCVGGVCSQHTGNSCIGPDGDGDCSESCNESADDCAGPDPTGSTCTDGLFCTGADSCSGGSCSLHVGSGCRGPDNDANCVESCNEAANNCTATDPDASACNDGVFCNGADKCLTGACSTHAGVPCAGPDGDANCAESCNEGSDNCLAADPNASACNDGVFCNGADSCAGGACTTHVGNPCPGADGDGNCAESCNETADTCAAADPNGSPCNDGLFCTGGDSCSAGSCSVHLGSGCPGADGDGNCAESCNEAADDCSFADSNGAPCNDGLFCNGADTCLGGTCSSHAGSPCPGADGDGNCAESCDEAVDACTAADPPASACTDGLFCNGADTCSGGTCSLHAGSPCPGAEADGNCSESCNEIGDVCTAADPDGAGCNDGLFCTGADSCLAGSCSQHAGSPCPGTDGDGNCAESCNEAADACTAADPNGSACHDGVFCNGADSCAAGLCVDHAGDPCPGADSDGDCTETCDESADACTGADPDTIACDDALFCNGSDRCAAGNCSVHSGDPCTGPDADGDCSESCNESSDTCEGADPDEAVCNDGLACNGADSCAGGFCTQHEGSLCPGADGDGNCSESCSDSRGGCSGNDPAGSPCDDGVFCNGVDTCLGGACSVHAGDPCPGADGDGDCTESCNETSDTCSAPDGNGSACDDGVFCNGADSCAGGLCGSHGGNPCVGADGDDDCAESCSEAADLCTAADPNSSPCNDGVFCNGGDSCSAGLCGAHAGNPCEGPDGDGDCSEACDETLDECTGADPGGTACNDGLFCNGADACSLGACSAHEGDPCEGPDGDGDCSESCSENQNSCDAADSDASACDDGLFCNGSDLCDGAGSCTGREPVDCDDDDPCTQDACIETDPHCSNVAIPNCPSTTTTTVVSVLCGDTNEDGNVTAGDALTVLKSAVGRPDCDQRVCVCDVNASQDVTATDALLVLRRAVGLPLVLTCDC